MFKRHERYCIILLLVQVAGCTDSQISETPRPEPETRRPETTDDTAIESKVLKQEMIDATVDIMKTRDSNIDLTKIRGQVERAILQIRRHDAGFLFVSAETEGKLKAGSVIQDSAKRIADAQRYLSEFGIQPSGLVQVLLPQYEAGSLTPARTELLAHLIVAEMKATDKALSN